MADTKVSNGWAEFKNLTCCCYDSEKVFNRPLDAIRDVGYAMGFVAEAMAGRPDEPDKSITSVACDGLSVIMRALNEQLDMAHMAIKTRAPELMHGTGAEEEVAQ